jgi:hypothetical protein
MSCKHNAVRIICPNCSDVYCYDCSANCESCQFKMIPMLRCPHCVQIVDIFKQKICKKCIIDNVDFELVWFCVTCSKLIDVNNRCVTNHMISKNKKFIKEKVIML